MKEPSQIRRVLSIAAAAIALIFVTDRAAAWVCAKLVSVSQDRYVDLYEGRSKADIVVFGNSRADHHFPAVQMSAQLGLSVKNYGIGGVSTVLIEALLRDHVERNGKPKVVILENHNLIVSPGEPGDLRLFATYSQRLSEIVKRETPSLYYSGRALKLVQYNSEMFFRVLLSIRHAPADRLLDRSVPAVFIEGLKATRPFPLTTHPDNEAALRRISEFCAQEHIPLYVIVAPFLPEQAAAFSNLQEWIDATARTAGPSAHFLDYSRSVTTRSFFLDGTHLNVQGVAQLFEMMKRDGVYDIAKTPK
jgi:lysophospholipase L1-like esterase